MHSPELVLPEDRPVEFKIKTKDVIHSFWVPQFRLKSDAVPGLTTAIRLTPDRVGRYEVVCAELCGIGHSTMRQYVRVVRRPSSTRLARQAGEGGARDRRSRTVARRERRSTVTLAHRLFAPGWYRAALGTALGFGFGMGSSWRLARSTAGTRCSTGTRSSRSAP